MKICLQNLVLASITLVVLLIQIPTTAASIDQLTIIGDDKQSGIIGNYSTTATFSWMSQAFPDNSTGVSWSLSPGSNKGILFGQAQNTGELISIRPMFNQPTTFFSVGTGLTINESDLIDMGNLRMRHAGTTIDAGSGSGYVTQISRVSDINFLTRADSGWILNEDGSYFLIIMLVAPVILAT